MLKTTACRFLLPLSAIAGLAGCRAGDPPAPPLPVVLVQAAAPAPARAATYTGEIRARHEVDLAFRVGGKIAARLVDVGAEIKSGQALARLDPTDLELAASAARAQLAAAESEASTAAAERERYLGLLTKKFVSQAAFEARDNTLNSARARLDQLRSQSRISTNQAGYGTLSSPFPAVVTAVVADTGQVVSPGQAVFRVARPDELEVAIAVPEGRVSELQAAKGMRISLWAAPALTLQGELRELAPLADPASRTYAGRIRIINPSPAVRLGMTARVALSDEADSDLLVPLSAVVDLGKGPVVRVVEDGKIASRPVRVATFRDDGVSLAAGLQPGEQIIVSGAGHLAEGQAVQAKPLTPPERQR